MFRIQADLNKNKNKKDGRLKSNLYCLCLNKILHLIDCQ